MEKNITFGFIGLGLIGGSIAKGLKRANPDCKIMAYTRHISTLEAAYKDKTIDIILDGIDKSLLSCDYIFLCTPVSFNAEYLKAIRPFIKSTCIITDVGSTKTNIHEEIIALGLENHFIGGHPMAGSEKTGYENSTDHLVENAYYVITPTKTSSQDQINKMTALVKSLNAIPIVLDYREHDLIVAAISHVPHVIASLLVNLVESSDSKAQTMKRVAAGGFKDITRIASSSPEMWKQICMTNSGNIVLLLKKYISSMEKVIDEIEKKDDKAIYNLFETSGNYRNTIDDKPKGLIQKDYVIYCDILDQAGAIATIATTLAIHQISIKNIGIIHNREFEAGVLKIEFYDETSANQAASILKECNYTIFTK